MKRKLNENDVPEAVGDKGVKGASGKATFTSLDLDSRLLQAITGEKFAAPTPVQAKGIPLALSGKDVLARAKTGSGKTLAYILPILDAILKRNASANKQAKQTTALILVPTKELAAQVTATLQTFTAFSAQDVRFENISRKEDAAVTRSRLAESPDVVVATPGRATQWLNQDVLQLGELKHLVIDEADLVLNYGYEEDLQGIAAALPSGVQKIMMSATLRTEVDTLTALFFSDGAKPTILDLSAEEAAEKPTLSQYVVRTAEEDKFLLIYTIFKLQLIKGKVIIFVADVDRCYRVKLFLEQFGIRSCVLNSELPVNSRLHVVEEFNKGVYDIIVAADENEVVGDESGKRKKRKVEVNEEEEEARDGAGAGAIVADTTVVEQADAEKAEAETAAQAPKAARKPRRRRADREYGVSRGIDFRHVSCVLNFDLPETSKSYTHRIGRTARAGQTGMALSFYVPKELYRKHKPTSIPQCEHDEKVLETIRSKQEEKGGKVDEWQFDMTKLEGFRYRLADALRAVTRIAVREARTKELRQELINSEKLKRHFEENPEDLRHLRHDTETHAVRAQPHLKHVPDYLLPAGGKAAVAKEVGSVAFRKEKENGLRKRRAFNKGRGKGRIAKGKGLDPLKSLNAKGRGRK
ncbi:hypothetical protein LTR36_003947 [Oleoguttula mirabilis]|uniref:RNA helicase n=1 Tax=Oleoguttula mirabilis TaxID=1507867 RepID=A0AAV9JHR4_9PEZI|nr:hypothetical protein LTR36_003947 [Oleoguttula mirabilis]